MTDKYCSFDKYLISIIIFPLILNISNIYFYVHRYAQPFVSGGTAGRTSTPFGRGWHGPCLYPPLQHVSVSTASSSHRPSDQNRSEASVSVSSAPALSANLPRPLQNQEITAMGQTGYDPQLKHRWRVEMYRDNEVHLPNTEEKLLQKQIRRSVSQTVMGDRGGNLTHTHKKGW